MIDTLITLLNQYGYIGITVLIAVENIFPPIPSEVILTFSGFMTTYSRLTPAGVIACATAGSTIGAVVLYELGYLLTQERMEKFLYGKLGKILHFHQDDVEYTMTWFRKKRKIYCLFLPLRSYRAQPYINSCRYVQNAMGRFSGNDCHRFCYLEYSSRQSGTLCRAVMDHCFKIYRGLRFRHQMDFNCRGSILYTLYMHKKKSGQNNPDFSAANGT